jgi:hypothetical protein
LTEDLLGEKRGQKARRTAADSTKHFPAKVIVLDLVVCAKGQAWYLLLSLHSTEIDRQMCDAIGTWELVAL